MSIKRNVKQFRRAKEHLRFRELCFDLQFASDEEKEAIMKEMIEMKDNCEDPLEINEMITSIKANINAEEARNNNQ